MLTAMSAARQHADPELLLRLAQPRAAIDEALENLPLWRPQRVPGIPGFRAEELARILLLARTHGSFQPIPR